jgi:hypothetical protein
VFWDNRRYTFADVGIALGFLNPFQHIQDGLSDKILQSDHDAGSLAA